MSAAVQGDAYEAATHTYYLAGQQVPGVTTVLKAAGIIDTTFLRNQAALTRGTRVHSMCEAVDATVAGRQADRHEAAVALCALSGELGYMRAYRQLLFDHKPRYTHVEHGLLHPTLRFGGRPDRICADLAGGGPAILEIKTGSPASWHGVQLAAYQMLFPTGARWVVYLKPDGRYNLTRVTGSDDYGRFMQALADYRAAQETR